VLQVKLWSQNPHFLGDDFMPAVEIFKNWPEQHLRDPVRPNQEVQSVTD
jgi:hypothetical protein